MFKIRIHLYHASDELNPSQLASRIDIHLLQEKVIDKILHVRDLLAEVIFRQRLQIEIDAMSKKKVSQTALQYEIYQ